jgi:hypothetical protein
MRGLPRVKQVRSLSKAGLSQVVIIFEDGVDTYVSAARTPSRGGLIGGARCGHGCRAVVRRTRLAAVSSPPAALRAAGR